jgi:hypothetical protein
MAQPPQEPSIVVSVAGAGLFFWLLVAGFTLSSELLVTVSAILGGVIMAPVWFVWLGRCLRGVADPVPAQAASGTLVEV